jgi:type III pantothenate kinase
MLLTLDIGNTNIKLALFKNDNLAEFRVHSEEKTVINYINHKNFSEAAICSVNPGKEKIFIEAISKKGIFVLKVSIKSELNLKMKYKTPETLGMDRVCSAAGAYETALKEKILFKNQYLLSIDSGTATTINVVSPEGEFIGGLIAPGIKTMLKSLNEKTAQLPIPDIIHTENFIGDSTNSSIVSGVITSTIGMINETVNHLKSLSNGTEPIIFITGGNAQLILPYIKHKIYFEEALVLKGLKVIYDLNK